MVALGAEQQQAVQDIAVAELTRQKERLAGYTLQARFAVAQLYDRANRPLRLNLPNAGAGPAPTPDEAGRAIKQ